MIKKIHGVEIRTETVTDENELEAYVKRGLGMDDGENLVRIDVEIAPDDPEDVEIKYHFRNRPFDRIRRITGYLVGTLDRFNNGKRAEERDRVKHGLPTKEELE